MMIGGPLLLLLVFVVADADFLKRTIALHPGLAPTNSGILLVHRDSPEGTRLEYRDSQLLGVYHEKSFPLSDRSFAIEQGDSDAVVIAETRSGKILRANHDSPDQIGRPSPRAITSDEENGIIMWLEGNPGKQSMFAVSVMNPATGLYATTVDAPLGVDNCRNATHTSSARIAGLDYIVVAVVCDNLLHLIKVQLPLAPFKQDGTIPIEATSVMVEKVKPLTGTVAIALDPITYSVYVARSGNEICQIDRLFLNLTTEDSGSILIKQEKVFECKSPSSHYRMRGLSIFKDYLYVSSYTPGSLNTYANAISRIFVPSLSPSRPGGIGSLQLMLNRSYKELVSPELFSPGFLHIKHQNRGAHHLYWLDLLDGRISRMTFVDDPHATRPHVYNENVLGHSVPADVALMSPNVTAGEYFPTLFWSDHGTNCIQKYPLDDRQDWKDIDSGTDHIVIHTERPPSSLIIDESHRMIYWSEPERSVIVAYNIDKKATVATLQYTLDSQITPSRFNSIAYLPSLNRVYVADSYPSHKRILSWPAPDPNVGYRRSTVTEETWNAGASLDIIPLAIVADPKYSVLYVSHGDRPAIYAFFLNSSSPVDDDDEDGAAGLPHDRRHDIKDPSHKNNNDNNASPNSTDEFQKGSPFHIPPPHDSSYGQQQQPPSSSSHFSSDMSQPPSSPGGHGGPDFGSHGNSPSSSSVVGGTTPEFGEPTQGTRMPRGRHAPPSFPFRKLMESNTHGPVVRMFHEGLDRSVKPVTHMWINDGSLHWAEVRQTLDGEIETTLKYKPTVMSDSAAQPLYEDTASVFSRSNDQSFVALAQFFDVHEGYWPKSFWEVTGYAMMGIASFILVILACRFFCCTTRRVKNQEEFQKLTDDDQVASSGDVNSNSSSRIVDVKSQ